MNDSKLRALARRVVYFIISPMVSLADYLNISPNVITTLGFVLNVVGASLFIIWSGDDIGRITGYIGFGSLILSFAALLDLVDGQLARLASQESEFGAFYDSVLDRYSDLIIYSSVGIFLLRQEQLVSSVLCLLSLIAAVNISYASAKAASFNIKTVRGYMPREARLSILTGSGMICGLVGCFAGGNILLYHSKWLNIDIVSIFTASLAITAVFGNITALQRIISAYKQLGRRQKGKAYSKKH